MKELVFGVLAALYLASAIIAVVRFRGALGAVVCFAGFMLGCLGWMTFYAHETAGPLAEAMRSILPVGRRGSESVLFAALVGGHSLIMAGLVVSPSSADRRRLNEHLRNHPPIKCPECGIEHPPNATRCLNCKAKLPPASEPH